MSYLDHVPANDDTRATMREAYDRMRALYVSVFGKPDPDIWTNVVATCGDSYSGFIPPSDESANAKSPFESAKN